MRAAMRRLAVLAAVGAACLATLCRADTGSGSGLANRLDAAQDAARVKSVGKVIMETVGDQVGGHDTRRPAWTIGQGGSLEWSFHAAVGQPVTLEFEELYGRDAEVRGYTILVNGVKTYFRTFRGCGAGPAHFFVQMPAQEKPDLTVRILNEHDVPVSISRAWCFVALAEHVRAGGMDTGYAFAPTVALSNDFEKDIAKLRIIKTSMADSPRARAAWTTWVGYANLTEFETRRQIDYVLRLARESGMPVQLSFDVWWGNSPSGSDGHGGTWLDVQYQQVVFDETTKTLQLSIPNRWSNTPWRTMNDPALNAYKTRRLTSAMTYLREEVSANTAAGEANPILSVNLDNEPVYWASGNAGLGNDELWADFNPRVIADAAKDGVTLDPHDGLAREERAWLGRNILRYNQFTADAAVGGLAKEAIVVRGESVEPTADPLAANVYTQAFVADPTLQFPLLEPTLGLWETAAPSGVRVGGEYNGDSQVELEAITHQIALGRSAAVNAEAGNRDEAISSVAPGYAMGLRYWTPYNWPLDKMQTAVRELADPARSLTPRLYERRILEDEFRGDAWKSHVVEQGGVEAKILGNTAAMAIAPISADAPGHLTYHVTAPADDKFEGLTLELNGRAFVSKAKDANVCIRVLAGDQAEPSSMHEVKRIFDNGDINEVWRIDLRELARGRADLYVRLELNAPGLSGEHLSWCSLRRVAFAIPWPAEMTTGLPPQDVSLATLRSENLIVSWRRDAELAIDALAKQVGDRKQDASMWQGKPDASPAARLAAARAAYDAGRYADAYHAACKGAASTLPTRYRVQAAGPLDPYPMRVETSSPMTVEVRDWSDQSITVMLNAGGDQAAKGALVLSKLPPGQTFTQTTGGSGETILARNANGPLAVDAKGELRVDVVAAPVPALPLATKVVGELRSSNGKLQQMQVVLDDGDGMRTVHFDDNTDFKLTELGETNPEPRSTTAKQLARGQQVIVTTDDAGLAREVEIQQRLVESEIEAFTQMSPTAMPSLRLKGDSADHVLALLAVLHLPEGDVTPRAQDLGAIDVVAGDYVRVRINPVSGRVVELWKR